MCLGSRVIGKGVSMVVRRAYVWDKLLLYSYGDVSPISQSLATVHVLCSSILQFL